MLVDEGRCGQAGRRRDEKEGIPAPSGVPRLNRQNVPYSTYSHLILWSRLEPNSLGIPSENTVARSFFIHPPSHQPLGTPNSFTCAHALIPGALILAGWRGRDLVSIGAGLRVLIDNPTVRLGQSPSSRSGGREGGGAGFPAGGAEPALERRRKGLVGGRQWKPASRVLGTEHRQPDPRRGGRER